MSSCKSKKRVNAKTNHYDDTLITFESNKEKPTLAYIRYWLKKNQRNMSKSLILAGFTIEGKEKWENNLFFLGYHPQHGAIWGNHVANQHWPCMSKSTILGAGVCLFLNFEGRIFWVALKTKHSRQLCNPGGMCERGEYFQQTAIREVKEELDLTLSNPLQFLIEKMSKTHYGHLLWKTKKQFFLTLEIMPLKWQPFISPYPQDVIQIKVDNNMETEFIYLIPIEYLQKGTRIKTQIPINYSHWELARMALLKEKNHRTTL